MLLSGPWRRAPRHLRSVFREEGARQAALSPSRARPHCTASLAFAEGSRCGEGSHDVLGRRVQVRERHVARLPAGESLAVRLGPLQPPVVALPQPVSVPQLRARLPQLRPLVVTQPQPAAAEPTLPLALAQAPPAPVQALLAVLLPQPLALPRPPPPLPPGRLARAPAEVLPVALALSVPEQVALPREVSSQEVLLRHHARAALLRLRPHRVPGGPPAVEGKVQDQVSQQERDPLSLK